MKKTIFNLKGNKGLKILKGIGIWAGLSLAFPIILGSIMLGWLDEDEQHPYTTD